MDFLITLSLAATTLAVPGARIRRLDASHGNVVDDCLGRVDARRRDRCLFRESRDGGRTFAAPVRVNDVEGDARISGEQPPHVALAPCSGEPPSVIVVWTRRAPPVRGCCRRDRTTADERSQSTVVPGGDAAGNRGWESLTIGADGAVYAVWLDHRELAGHEGHMSPEQSKLYLGSIDGIAPPRPITGGVCYCCKTAIATGPDGSVFAAWRHVYPGNIRDIAFTASHDGGKTFAAPLRVSEDKWVLEGCPGRWAGDGSGCEEPRAHRVADTDAGRRVRPDDCAVLCDERGRAPVHAAQADADRGHAASSADCDRRRRVVTIAWDELKDGKRHAVIDAATVDARGKAAFKPRMVVNGTPRCTP